ncbi:MAG TPA: type II secretion system F family protein [Beijerinckiaceae bacterium]|nr:type II secretion system F family protein [Beijerinckiaceae bacterium]
MTSTLAAVVLAAIAAGGVAYALVYPLLSGEARAEKRQKALLDAGPKRRTERGSGQNRRDQVAQSLKEIETRNKARNRVSLENKLLQAGLSWTKKKFFLVSAGSAAAHALLLLIVTGSPLFAAVGLFVGWFGLPNWILAFRRKKRIRAFVDDLPNAMDVIVRGIRSGLPLNDCLRIIANESKDPLKSEFKAVVETQTVGIPLTDAVAKIYERVPVPEANFFGIVIGIQQKGGGNLSETLSNVSKVIRERRKMAEKIKAMSMEAKASAAIIASLPFAVALLTYMSSPSYIELLWTTTAGKIALVVSGMWMTVGVLVMRKMINFDF